MTTAPLGSRGNPCVHVTTSAEDDTYRRLISLAVGVAAAASVLTLTAPPAVSHVGGVAPSIMRHDGN